MGLNPATGSGAGFLFLSSWRPSAGLLVSCRRLSGSRLKNRKRSPMWAGLVSIS